MNRPDKRIGGKSREDPMVQLSKLLSKILRHKAQDFGIPIRSDGYVKLTDLMRHQSFRHYTVEDVHNVVTACSKQRFALSSENGVEYIRAQQGHTIAAVADEELLERIEDSCPLQYCYHGTYAKLVDSIKATGLNRMARNHVHLTPALPGDGNVISGMRRSADVIVVVDMRAAMRAGIPFFRSGNNVILSPGLDITGCIPPQYIVDYKYRDERKRRAVDISDVSDPRDGRYPLYYCVIDFEATCVENGKISNQEIIEFPAILVNAETMEAEAEFHSYVRPVWNPQLSPFCTRLTGIEQATVDSAPVFADVYNMFLQFLHAHGCDVERNWSSRGGSPLAIDAAAPARKIIEFASYGDFEFRTILPNQCQMAGIDPPGVSRQWINVKTLFSRNFPSAKDRGNEFNDGITLDEIFDNI